MNSRGFTLFEILLVLAIMAMLSGIVLVFNYQIRTYKDLETAIQAVAAVVRDAQQKSITQEEAKPWGVRFEVSSGVTRYALFKETNATLRARYLLPPTVQFDTAGWDDLPPGVCPDDCFYDLTFTSVDGLPAAGADVILELHLRNDPDTFKRISVFANGTITY